MPIIKKIWRDNTMPPTNYIWMRTNKKDQLIGVYEWLNGQWCRIYIDGDECDTYNKQEIDILLQYTEQEIVDKILKGEYTTGSITVDEELSFVSSNPVTNRRVTTELAEKVDRIDFDMLKNSLQGVTGLKYGTTEEWNNDINFIPMPGEIVVYSDYKTKEVDGKTVYIPGIKIGSGNAYIQDLAFVNDDVSEQLYDHIRNTAIHVTEEEKQRWNNKLNVDDTAEVLNESLIFNRN